MNEQEKFSGAYGFVVKPDQKTQEVAEQLAETIAPKAEFHVKVPHITLYHAKFDNLPKSVIEEKLNELSENEGISLTLNNLQIYGEKFIFWNVEDKNKLRSLHYKALETSQFLNKDELAKAIEEGLSLNTKEQGNIKRFGHPLVLEDYLPHITLAYNSSGIQIPSNIIEKPFAMKIDKIHFAEMGPYGSVKQIVL